MNESTAAYWFREAMIAREKRDALETALETLQFELGEIQGRIAKALGGTGSAADQPTSQRTKGEP